MCVCGRACLWFIDCSCVGCECVSVCVCVGGGRACLWFIDCSCVGCECVCVCVCVCEGGGPAFGSLIVHVWAVSV